MSLTDNDQIMDNTDPVWRAMMLETLLPQEAPVPEQNTFLSDDSGHDPQPLARGRSKNRPSELRLQPQAQSYHANGRQPVPFQNSSSVSASLYSTNPDDIQVFSPFLSPPPSASMSLYHHRSGSLASHSSHGDIDPMEVLRLGSSGPPSSAGYSDSSYTAASSANLSPAPWPEQGLCESPSADINSEEYFFDSQATERRRSRSASPRRGNRNPTRRRSSSSPPTEHQTGAPFVGEQPGIQIKAWIQSYGDASSHTSVACAQCRQAKTRCERPDGNVQCVRCTRKRIQCEPREDHRTKEFRSRHQN